MNADEILSTAQVQALTGLSEPTLRRWAAAGKFPEKIPIGFRDCGYVKRDVLAWLEQREQQQQRTGGNGSSPTLQAVAQFRYPARFKRESEAEVIAAHVRALGPRVEREPDGFYVVTVPSHRPAATAKYLRNQFPHTPWGRAELTAGEQS